MSNYAILGGAFLLALGGVLFFIAMYYFLINSDLYVNYAGFGFIGLLLVGLGFWLIVNRNKSSGSKENMR
jgi:hypothetical protein